MKTVSEYLKSLPPDRRKVVSAVRSVVKRSLPKGYVEAMQYGTIAYVVPFSRLADTYNGQPLTVCALASQKHNVSLYLMSVYASKPLARWFKTEWKKSGKKLDMGKSCLRFRDLDDLALDVLSQALGKVDVDTFIAQYEKSRGSRRKTAASKKRKSASRRSTSR
jgi:hypothetical protein